MDLYDGAITHHRKDPSCHCGFSLSSQWASSYGITDRPPVPCPKVSQARVAEDVHQCDPGGIKCSQYPQLGIWHLKGAHFHPRYSDPWWRFRQVAEELGPGIPQVRILMNWMLGTVWKDVETVVFAAGIPALLITDCATWDTKTTFLCFAVSSYKMGMVIPTLKDFCKLVCMKVAGTQWLSLFRLILMTADVYEVRLYVTSCAKHITWTLLTMTPRSIDTGTEKQRA